MLVDQKLSGVKDRWVQRDQLALTFPLSIKDIHETLAFIWTKHRHDMTGTTFYYLLRYQSSNLITYKQNLCVFCIAS